jgi:hypothetical protein
MSRDAAEEEPPNAVAAGVVLPGRNPKFVIRAVVAAAHPPRRPKSADPRVAVAAATERKEKAE